MIDAFERYFIGGQGFEGLGAGALKTSYEWKIPKKLFDGTPTFYSGSNFEANVDLKKELSQRWQKNPDHRRAITKWIISDWGGIRRNSEMTLNDYYIRALEESPATPLKGIASFSKVLAVKDPKRYAIYDARVAVSLNAIQLIANVDDGMAFPYLKGRNNITGNWSSRPRRGFSTMPEVAVKTLTSKSNAWSKVQDDEAYWIYLNTLQEITKRLGINLYELEMTLFSQAEDLACKFLPGLTTG